MEKNLSFMRQIINEKWEEDVKMNDKTTTKVGRMKISGKKRRDALVVVNYRLPQLFITYRHVLYRGILSHTSIMTWSRKQVTNYLAHDVETSNL
jgi:hypothetical protein